MRNKRSIDGFIPRGTAMGHNQGQRRVLSTDSARPALHTGSNTKTSSIKENTSNETTVGRATGIHESLQALDKDVAPEKVSRRNKRRLRKSGIHKKSKKRRIIKWIVIGIATAVIAVVLYLALMAFITANKVFDGGLFGFAQKQALQEDSNGRSNFLIFGTAEDNENGQHDGADLTDSLMVVSVNQTTKDAFMVSIPRDLWVEYGTACLSGYQGKINAVYGCHADGDEEAVGAAALQKKIGDILGLDIQYYVHLNFTAVVELVDAVGGVTVTIESNPAGMGILDRNFDWKCGYRCHYVKYEDGQVANLDGEHALALSRARNAQGGYGLAAGNFDREKNQQKIIKALREKAMSVGTLTNLGKVTGIMGALGNNLRTNINTKEIQTLMSIASEISDDSIVSLTLVDEESPLVTTGMIGTNSAVYPIAGRFNYTAIRAYIAKNVSNNPVVRENAKIVVLNGAGIAGLARAEADALTAKGFTISRYDNAAEGTYDAVEIYQIGEGNSPTADALKKHYQVDAVKKTEPPLTVDSEISFVVVIGAARDQQ